MKRFVVIATSLLIIFVFVTLNYLLWDRESLVTLKESNQASIDVLSRINMSLGEEKNRLRDQTDNLEEQVGKLEAKMTELEEDILKQKSKINEQTEFILAMKMQLNPLPIKTAALDWVNLLSEKSYGSAFLKSEADCRYWQNEWNLSMFTNYFEQNIEQIQLMLVGDEQQPSIEIIPFPSTDWNINVKVHIQVELKENIKEDYFKQGENILELTYTYNERIEQWRISKVISEAVKAEEQQAETELPQKSD